MKNKILYLIAIIFSSVLFSSCEDMFGNFLEKQPSNELTEDQVFSLWSNAEKFHYDTYNFLRNGAGRVNNSWLDAATDLAHTSYSWAGVRSSFNIGNYYASSGAPELTSTWESYYRGIRKCNMLLEKIDSVPKDITVSQENYETDKMNFKGEARFLRAYFYWEMFLRYGPVPLVTKVLDPNSDLTSDYKTRPTVNEFVNFILTELQQCEPMLMDNPSATNHKTDNNLVGRINKPMASALYSRIKLYMASPRYAQYNVATWQDAAAAAKHFIDTYGSQYGLYYDPSGDPATNYQQAILLPVFSGNNEVIFWRNDPQITFGNIVNDTPVGEGGNGGLCPSQNLVDMYDMANGQSPFTNYDETGSPAYDNAGTPTINAASGYDDQKPYDNRDPRFYATALYNGVQWNNRAINVVKGQSDNPIGNANATPTGYYDRKYIPVNILTNNHGGAAYRNWIFIRYAEILLNYAEAMNEANGPSAEVFNALQQVRNRAGLTALLSSRADLQTQDALRNFIHKERTVEFAFEEQRWWDVRRWGVAEQALARPIYGMEVLNDNGTVSYQRKVVSQRVFNAKMYLYPIPETEVWKTGMENNPGW